MPDPSLSWNRTLPKPTALLQNNPGNPFSSRRESSLLRHHIVSSNPSWEGIECTGRRSTVPCIAYPHRPESPKHFEPASVDPRLAATSDRTKHTRGKRSASCMAEESPSRDQSPSSPTASEGAGQFCLCQPDPKIPRPRNAFILYRQHQQAGVVAANPGLPNPEISKIIGQQWGSLPAKAKSEWKALAEEEKARHQQQYPDYRYQPRRNGRYSNQSSVSGPSSGGLPVGPEGNCLKCGGKTMNPPNTPYPPYTPMTSGMQHQMVALPPARRAYTVTTQQNGRQMVTQPVLSPQTARVRPYAEVFGRPVQDPRVRYPGPQPPTPMPMIVDSPDPKRRRFNGNGVQANGHYVDPTQHFSPYATTFGRPDAVQPRTTMAPPARAMYTQTAPQIQAVHPQARRDPSLTLPPLKTSTTSPPRPAASQTQKSGIEAMIMSIPVLNKVKILSQISPHLAGPSLTTPAPEVRGAIMAVEGMDASSVYSMTNSLAEQLERDGKFAVRVFGGPEPVRNGETMTTEGFLRTISEWHKISREMVQYLTTRPADPSVIEIDSRRGSLPRVGSAVTQTGDHRPSVGSLLGPSATNNVDVTMTDSAISPKTITQTADLRLTSPNEKITTNPSTTANTTPIPSRHPSSSHLNLPPPPPLPPPVTTPIPPPPPQPTSDQIPIAIVPAYQLTTVDTSAIAMPITDSYSPLSHWQWLATLWRGCVGPDVTVVIKSTENEDGGSSSSSSVNGEKDRVPAGVEVRLLDCRAVVVRTNVKEGVASAEDKGEGENWEKAKRRVGFEVEEFLRR